MRTDKQRIAKYKAKTDPATVRLKVAAMLPVMKANYAVSADEEVALETAVRNWLAQQQVALDHFCYLNFAKQVYWKVIKKYSGAKLVSEAQSKKDKGLIRGARRRGHEETRPRPLRHRPDLTASERSEAAGTVGAAWCGVA